MRSPAKNPRFGMHGHDRSQSPHQNMTRPQFTRPPPPFGKDSRQLRGNGNQNRNRRFYGHHNPVEGPGRPMMPPVRPMMNPNGPMPCGPPMMMPCGPVMGPNGPMVPPGFMDPSSFNMMMKCMPPGAPMPMGSTRFPNGNFPKTERVLKNEKNKSGAKEDTDQDMASNDGENCFYNYPQSTNFGWQGNAFPGGWNFPMNQYYPQNSGQYFDPQFCNSQTFNPNQDESFEGNYNQYQNQSYVQGNYLDQQNHSYNKANFDKKNWQNGAHSQGSKNPEKNNRKKKEMSQKMRMHYCDTCDKSFPTEDVLATHLSEHKVCGLDDCKFKAHPKVVEKHQRMQHFTGLYRRIGSLYTPEDIEKWRKDRKKNYPTPQNVEERRVKQEEMFARGERMGGSNNRGFSRQNQHQNGRHFQQRQRSCPNDEKPENVSSQRPPDPCASEEPPKKWKPVFPPVTFEIEESEQRSGVRPFPGTAALLPKNAFAETDATLQTTEKMNVSSSLSFLSMYGDSSSEEEEDTGKSLEDSTTCLTEENTATNESCVPEPTILDTSASAKSDPESSSNPPPDAASIQTSVEDDSECPNQTEDVATGEPVLSLSGGSESNEGVRSKDDIPKSVNPSSSRPPQDLTTEPGVSVTVSSTEKCALDKAGPVSEPPENPTGTRFPEEPPCDAAPSEKMSVTDAGDDTDDSSPEEVPFLRSNGPVGDQENSNDEEVEEVAKNGEGGRKRRRHSRQPPKRAKIEDGKPANESRPQQQNKNTKHCETVNRPQRPHPPVKRYPTLLEKLLSKEICHERNVILQCVRHVVENNFFRGDRLQDSKRSTP